MVSILKKLRKGRFVDMTAIETKIPGVMTDVFVVDHRGYFDEIYNKPKHESLGTKAVFVQDNMFFCTERNIS